MDKIDKNNPTPYLLLDSEYRILSTTKNVKSIIDKLEYLCSFVKSEKRALTVSLLKWTILTENEKLDLNSQFKLGTSMSTCGLCHFFGNICEECHKFTGFNKRLTVDEEDDEEDDMCSESLFHWVDAIKNFNEKDEDPHEAADKVRSLIKQRLLRHQSYLDNENKRGK